MDSHKEEILSLLKEAASSHDDDVQIVYIYKKIKELGLKDKLWSARCWSAVPVYILCCVLNSFYHIHILIRFSREFTMTN